MTRDEAIGKRIRAWRGRRAQADLVRNVNLPHFTQSTLSRVELGTRPLRLTEAVRLAEVFAVPLYALADYDERDAASTRSGELDELRRKIDAIRELLA